MTIREALAELVALKDSEPMPRSGEYGMEWTVRKHEYATRFNAAWAAARAALAAEPAQEAQPVAWLTYSEHYKEYETCGPNYRQVGDWSTPFPVYTAPQPPQPESEVPEGYVLVPKTPTQSMCQAGQWKAQEWPKFPLRISPIYQAMLAAAPTQAEQGEQK